MNSSITPGVHAPGMLFENLPELLKPEKVASILGISVSTIYDWHYRMRLKKVPQNLFLKFNRLLFIRTNVLRDWIVSQNPETG